MSDGHLLRATIHRHRSILLGGALALALAGLGCSGGGGGDEDPIAPIVPTQLVLTTSAVGAESGAEFTTQPVVAIRDAAGNTVTSSSSVVTMTVSTGATVTGTATATASGGVATFATVGISGTVGAS